MNCLSSLQNRMMKRKDYTYENGLEYKMYDGYHNDDVIYTSTMRNGIKGNSSDSTVCLDGIGEGTGWNIVEDDGEDLSVEWIGYIYTRLNVSGVYLNILETFSAGSPLFSIAVFLICPKNRRRQKKQI